MKGIILAGGAGTRLYPITQAVSKQLLPIYDKPMIYYPLSVLMLAKIRDILIITTPEDNANFKRLLGDGSQFGISIQYAVQEKPNGIAQAFIIGEEFIDGDSICLVLGDNIFYGAGFSECITDAKIIAEDFEDTEATVFGYLVNDPERYGVAGFDEFGKCTSIEEKPLKPKSNYAVTGLYFYPSDVIQKAKGIVPSARGELEITAVNKEYLKENRLRVERLPRGFAWLDTGTFGSLSEASSFVETVEKRTGLQIGCLEEIAFRNGWVSREIIEAQIEKIGNNDYKKYLMQLLN